ncbi:glycosyltransferase [Chamaesiphon sp. OTE_8_metabat_110]|uniref:glycosyltransferase family protein n=1 Tax=Chamaesiphon sp. OTE_8_metabat_110 TaxID=2964696 RepID=UPI00286BA035|nr:glycosyltransferase [Chamaesiphon sp. OTE_8_metabat_110]
MKILYINQIETCAGWGLETFINQYLLEFGATTICVDYEKNAYSLAHELLKINENFDVVLLERGCRYLIPIEILKAIKRPKIFLLTELVARNPNEHYLLNSGIFEHILFRSLPCMDEALAKGWLARHQLSLFLSAIDPSFHRYIENTPKDIDILFVGNLLPRRQEIIDELNKSFVVTIYTVFGQDMVKLINRAKIILNIHGTDLLDTETRVYETLACKGFLLTESLSRESPFQNGIHLVEAKNISDLKEKIAYYLDNDFDRESIAESGYQEVIHQHTFQQRAKQLIQTIEPYLSTHSLTEDTFARAALERCASWEVFYKARDETTRITKQYLSIVKQAILRVLRFRVRTRVKNI